MSAAPDADPYKVLQVDPEAEDEVIQAAYRRLAQKYHPDRSPGPDAADRMVAINAAWALVGDPGRRAAFDRERRTSAPSPPVTEQARPARPTSPRASDHPPETVSADWTSGRNSAGGGYNPSMQAPDGLGAAGRPPGNPSGSVLNFGRYAGWSLGEIARFDLEYIEWLDRMPIGRTYRDEIDAILRRTGRRQSAAAEASNRHGLFRRR
ncbi:MAG TPA: DnaJ domain-containing protein [Candidatus Limnocylindrales bacterium]